MSGTVPSLFAASTSSATATGLSSRLPLEVKSVIASFLDQDDAKSLSLVNREWESITEKFIWSCVSVTAPAAIWEDDVLSPEVLAGVEEQCRSQWRGLRKILDRRPHRARLIQKATLFFSTYAVEDTIAVLKALAPTLRILHQDAECQTHGDIGECSSTYMAHLICTLQPFPQLTGLKIPPRSKLVNHTSKCSADDAKISCAAVDRIYGRTGVYRRAYPMAKAGQPAAFAYRNDR